MLHLLTKQPELSYELSYDDLLEAEDFKRSFRLFVPAVWPILEPGVPFVPGWHIDAIAEHLQAVSDGQIRRLLVNMPPRHAKSTLISVMWPVWSWLSNPSEQWLCASYVMDLAERDNRRSRNLILHPRFQARYGHLFKLRHDQNEKGNFENNCNGYRIATSVGGAGTGKGGSRLLIDDPHPARDGSLERKAVSCEKAVEWYRETWSSRLNDRTNGAMVTVGQRIRQNDLSGHILEQGGCVHLNLPSEFDPGRKCFTSIGWEDPRKNEGELLWPAKFSQENLEAMKHDQGALVYACQFLQSPAPPGGHVFKSKDERLFTIDRETGVYLLETPSGKLPVEIKKCWTCTTSDVAAKAKEQNDFTVFSTWAITPDLDVLLLDVRRDHWTILEQEQQAKKVYHAFNNDSYRGLYFEDVGYQSAIGQHLIADGIPCQPFVPHADKLVRAGTASIWMGMGKVYFLKNALWLDAWQKEIYFFPKAAHDDQVDTFSMMCLVARQGYGSPIWSLDEQESDHESSSLFDFEDQGHMIDWGASRWG